MYRMWKRIFSKTIWKRNSKIGNSLETSFKTNLELPRLDEEAFYSQGDIVINPTYQGTGLKIKTFEAISFDKVTIVHPHSMTGVFKKDTAPLMSSERPQDWVGFLENIWENPDCIMSVKERNKVYLEEMNEYIVKEYKRFLKAEW